MKKYQDKIPLVLAIVLYILIYFVRLQQGGWDIELDLLPELRENLDKRIVSLLPSPQAQLLSGVVLGLKKDLPSDLKLALRDTSTLHMVVVSGQNLSLLAALILRLSGILTRRLAIALSILTACFYVILTGGDIPVLRAVLMAFLSLLAQFFGRQNDGLRVLVIVGGLLLLINPFWIQDLSFQLSFLATLGLVVITPILSTNFARLPLFLRENLAVTIGAQLMVFPVIAQNFHQLSLVSLPANLLTLWTIPYIMGWGLVLLVIASISVALGQIISLVLEVMLTYFIYIVKFFASLPFAWEYVGEQVWIVWVGYYMVLAAIVLSLTYVKKQNSRGSKKSFRRIGLPSN